MTQCEWRHSQQPPLFDYLLGHMRSIEHPLRLLPARRERPSRRAGERRQQFPSSNGDHMPLPCEGAAETVARLGRAVSKPTARTW